MAIICLNLNIRVELPLCQIVEISYFRHFKVNQSTYTVLWNKKYV